MLDFHLRSNLYSKAVSFKSLTPYPLSFQSTCQDQRHYTVPHVSKNKAISPRLQGHWWLSFVNPCSIAIYHSSSNEESWQKEIAEVLCWLIACTCGFHSFSSDHPLISIFDWRALSLSITNMVTNESAPHFLLFLASDISANRESPSSEEADISPFWPPNGSVMCCDTAGSDCQNSGPCSTAGQLFWRLLDWISASQQPAPRLTKSTLPGIQSAHRPLPKPA